MMDKRKLIVAAASGLAIAGSAPPAGAQVFVDPGSPSGKEYAIPLEEARREASSGGGDFPVEQGERSAPLFGEGVDGASGGSGDGSSGNGGGGRPSASDNERQRGSGADGTGGGSVDEALRSTNPVGAAVPQGGIGSASTIGIVALSVLLLGGVIGSIARRRAT
jgi:hypothetical protein